MILFFAAVFSYLFFVVRFSWQSIAWFRTSGPAVAYPVILRKVSAAVSITTLLDILFFRRLFTTGKFLWIGSWLFHVSFVLVALRHTRYFFRSLPECLIFLQPFGVAAGYLLPLSLLFLMMLRIIQKKHRYSSSYNYIISGMLLLISLTGVVMRTFFRPDLISVKQFALGIVSLRPQALPDSLLFLLHVGIFIALLPYLPTHILAAPFVNLEANRRREELRYLIHER